MLQFGRTSQAIQTITESLPLLDQSYVRVIAVTKLNLGEAYIQAKDIDGAASMVSDAAELAMQNRSTRLVKKLHTTRKAMRPWQCAKAVQELDGRLKAYGLA